MALPAALEHRWLIEQAKGLLAARADISVNEAFVRAAEGPMEGVLAYHREPLVSIDFNHDSHSSTVDLSATKVLDRRLVRVASWYDNEWGFSCRMNDVAAILGGL